MTRLIDPETQKELSKQTVESSRASNPHGTRAAKSASKTNAKHSPCPAK